MALDAEPTLTKMGVPEVWKYIKDEESKKVAELVITQQVFGRPYFLPAGTPTAQVEIMRKAFDATMKDAEFLADAQKLRLDIEPLGGAKVQEVIEKVYATPARIVDLAKAAVKP
jgi:hypothetical protein